MPPATTPIAMRRDRAERAWFVAALAMVVVLVVGVRLGRGVGALGPRFDEQWIRVPIEGIVHDGWSVRTAIDFEETKGPAMIWPYAAIGQIVGGELADLRWTTIGFFVIGTALLLMIARRVGVRGPGLVAVALLHCLVPQQLVLSQLVMSEVLFVTTCLAMILAFLWGFGDGVRDRADRVRGVTGPVLFGALLAIALHNRIHGVAFAAACCLVALQRDRLRAWPWVVAALVAGMSRLPLVLRWDGLVSPMYREMHQLGGASASILQWSNATYLLAALAPWTAVFLWPAWRGVGATWSASPDDRSAGRRWIVAAACVGLLLACAAPPVLASSLPAPPLWQQRAPDGLPRYLGLVATVARAGGASAFQQGLVLGALATIGSASLGAIAVLSWGRRRADLARASDERVLGRLTFWTLLSGIGLYVLTQAFVLDRYLLPWAALAPILWWRWLPRWLVAVLAAVLAAMTVQGVATWLA